MKKLGRKIKKIWDDIKNWYWLLGHVGPFKNSPEGPTFHIITNIKLPRGTYRNQKKQPEDDLEEHLVVRGNLASLNEKGAFLRDAWFPYHPGYDWEDEPVPMWIPAAVIVAVIQTPNVD